MPKKKQPEEVGIQLKEFGIALGQIAEEKGISEEKVLETVEASLAAAYKKDYGRRGQHIRAEFDKVAGHADFYLVKEVVDETTREFVEEEEEVDEEGISSGDQENTAEKKEAKESKKEEKKNQEPEKENLGEEEEEEKLPRYNAERDITLEEAIKEKKDAKVGDILEEKLESHDTFGRVAAQTAKQVIIQKIREAEREAMFSEYKEKEGEVVSGTIQRIEGRTVFVDIGKSTGVLLPSEQVRSERYRIGQRLKVYVLRVESDPKGPGIALSRASELLVQKLFELEVPEIFSGTVEVKAISREAGSRTKMAVYTQEESIDPIGSCVGQKGTRVQAVIDELGGEKIDIIEWDENIEQFIQAALSPAKVTSVELNEEEKQAAVHVPQDQLSLAIGKQGQNVRLAAKLTEYRIDVLGEDEVSEESSQEDEEASEEVDEEKEVEVSEVAEEEVSSKEMDSPEENVEEKDSENKVVTEKDATEKDSSVDEEKDALSDEGLKSKEVPKTNA